MFALTIIALLSIAAATLYFSRRTMRQQADPFNTVILAGSAASILTMLVLIKMAYGDFSDNQSFYFLVADVLAIAALFCRAVFLRSWNTALILAPAFLWAIFWAAVIISLSLFSYTFHMMG